MPIGMLRSTANKKSEWEAFSLDDDEEITVIAPPATVKVLKFDGLGPTFHGAKASFEKEESQMSARSSALEISSIPSTSLKNEDTTFESYKRGSLDSMNAQAPAVGIRNQLKIPSNDLPAGRPASKDGSSGCGSSVHLHSDTAQAPQPKRAGLAAALSYFGLTSEQTSPSSVQEVAAEVLELSIAIITSTACDVTLFVEAFTKEERKALKRLSNLAQKVGILSRTPRWSAPMAIQELALAFLKEEKDSPTTPNAQASKLKSSSVLRLGTFDSLPSFGKFGSMDSLPGFNKHGSIDSLPQYQGQGGQQQSAPHASPGATKRQVTFEQEQESQQMKSKFGLSKGGMSSHSSIGMMRSGSNIGGSFMRSGSNLGGNLRSMLGRSASDLSCTSFTDFNRRSKINQPNEPKPSFIDFLTLLDQDNSNLNALSTSPSAIHIGGNGPGPGPGQIFHGSSSSMSANLSGSRDFPVGAPRSGDSLPQMRSSMTRGMSTLDTVSEAGISYHSAMDMLEHTEERAVMGEAQGQVRIQFKTRCLRTENEWQRQLLDRQRSLLSIVSKKFHDMEASLQAGDELHREQKQLLQSFRKIIVREAATEDMDHEIAFFVIEKDETIRADLDDLIKILEYPCESFRSQSAAAQAIKDHKPPQSERNAEQTPRKSYPPGREKDNSSAASTARPARTPAAPVLEGRAGQYGRDWRSQKLCQTVTKKTTKAEVRTVKIVLLSAAWLGKELLPELKNGAFICLTSQGDELEEVGNKLLATSETEIREKLLEKGIHEYLMHPLSLESIRGVVSKALQQKFGDEYLLLQAVGRGTSGVVHRAKRLSDGGCFALKEINTRRLNKMAKTEVKREMQLLQELRWPTVVFIVDSWENAKDQLCYLLMPLLNGGSLLQRVEAYDSAGRPSQERVMEWYAQTLHGMTYMHWRGVLHRDLKPGNLLLADGERSLQVGDLGSAMLLPGRGPHPKKAAQIEAEVSTPLYAPPEVVLNEIYTSSSDMWAIGATFYEVLTTRTIVDEHSAKPEQLKAVMQSFNYSRGNWQNELKLVTDISIPPAADLANLFASEHMARPSAAELVGRRITQERLYKVLREVGALQSSVDRKAHFEDFAVVRKESQMAENLPAEEDS